MVVFGSETPRLLSQGTWVFSHLEACCLCHCCFEGMHSQGLTMHVGGNKWPPKFESYVRRWMK